MIPPPPPGLQTTKATDTGPSAPARPGSRDTPFDSNAITPGSPFMETLDAYLVYFIQRKIDEDADWRNIEVVLSGHQTPGEGEHKIMDFIRSLKSRPDHDPNTR